MTASPRRVGDKRALPVTIPTGMSVCGLENSSPFNDLMWRYPVFLARAEAAHEASEALPLTGRRKPLHRIDNLDSFRCRRFVRLSGWIIEVDKFPWFESSHAQWYNDDQGTDHKELFQLGRARPDAHRLRYVQNPPGERKLAHRADG